MEKTSVLFAFIILFGSCGTESQAPAPQVENNTSQIAVDTTQQPVADTILADPANQVKTIKFQAELMNDFLLKKDFKSFARYIHPKLIEKLGGEQKMIAAMESGFKQMEEKESAILKITLGDPGSVIENNKELQSVVVETVEMKAPGGILITKSILIAVSKDHGRNWYFIDTGNRDLATMQKELPTLSNALVLPKPEGPKFVKVIK